MKKHLLKFLPLMATIMLATSCSKDDENIQTQNVVSQKSDTIQVADKVTIPFSINVSTEKSVSKKMNYNEDGNEAVYVPETGDKLIISGEGISGELEYDIQSSCFSGELTATSAEVAAKFAAGEIKLTATYGEALEGVAYSSSFGSLVKESKHLYKAVFASNATEIKLTDNNAYLEINLPTTEETVSINGVNCPLNNGNVWVAFDVSNKINSARLSLFDKEVDPGQFYKVTRGESTFNDKAVFSVASGKKVHFSPGNLLYQASTGTWTFAERQHDVVGDRAGNTTEENRDKNVAYIDLFGWGMWLENQNPANASMPASGYLPKVTSGSFSGNLAIGSEWTTLTAEEWEYLLGANGQGHGRYNAWKLRKYAVVCDQAGLIILPDNCSVTFSEVYDQDAWAELEKIGAVFLPAVGYRQIYSIQPQSWGNGYYWSSVACSTTQAYCVYFKQSVGGSNDTDVIPLYKNNRGRGQFVRLVRIAN